MIIVSVTGPTMADALRQMKESRRWADIFELRLDLIHDLDIHSLLGGTDRPRIVTIRPRWEGGHFYGGEASRLAMVKKCAAYGVEFLDVELRAGRGIVEEVRRISPTAHIIVSLHSEVVPSSARRAYRMFAGCGGDVVKWAYPACDSADIRFAREFLRIARGGRQKAIAVAMGEPGEASRILYRSFGGWATYAAPEGGPEAAAGQLRGSFLAKTCRANVLTTRTRVFGLVGNPVVQSEGMILHNVVFRRRRANAVYVRFKTSDLPGFFRHVLPLLEGCSVTLPFKEAVAERVRKRDPEVTAIGAANTLYRDGGVWRVANSDASAGLDAIEGKCRVKGKTILILGAGGTARALAYEGRRRGAHVVIAGRTANRAVAAAQQLGVRAISWGEIGGIRYDILVNATPVGMYPRTGRTPLSRRYLRGGTLVFDAIARPRFTRLLREAELAGASVIGGREMFLRQAASQQELFLRRRVDLRSLRRAMPFNL